MGSIYRKKGTSKLYMSFKDASGKRRNVSTGLDVGREQDAERMLEQLERRIAAQVAHGEPMQTGPLTVAGFAGPWLRERKRSGLSDVDNDSSRMKHILGAIGHMPIEDVKTHHVRSLIRDLRGRCGMGKDDLAPRTVINISTLGRAMFDDAVVDGVVDVSPWQLKRGALPKKVDKDPEWRRTARFTLTELEMILSLNDHVPPVGDHGKT